MFPRFARRKKTKAPKRPCSVSESSSFETVDRPCEVRLRRNNVVGSQAVGRILVHDDAFAQRSCLVCTSSLGGGSDGGNGRRWWQRRDAGPRAERAPGPERRRHRYAIRGRRRKVLSGGRKVRWKNWLGAENPQRANPA